eukprot:TRINITY_DN1694_c0_g1_i1.p1 TRINITY_DN1694_c0_g1~~TRINITY_DN1694_c0_g1_i1.p1  ORF type:complete len:175 (+),score=25.82 TRINITY_DN1694_c0_g1_i1:167-691(+)
MPIVLVRERRGHDGDKEKSMVLPSISKELPKEVDDHAGILINNIREQNKEANKSNNQPAKLNEEIKELNASPIIHSSHSIQFPLCSEQPFIEEIKKPAGEKVEVRKELSDCCCLCEHKIQDPAFTVLRCKHRAHNVCICLIENDEEYAYSHCELCKTPIGKQEKIAAYANLTPD